MSENEIKIKPIEWTEERPLSDHKYYNYVIGKTACGEFLLTWKGWKDTPYHGLTIDETPFEPSGFVAVPEDLEKAKAMCQEIFNEKIRGCIDERE